MVKDTTLHFFSGKMAAGKSTLAAELVVKKNAILLCEDDWLAELYPDEIADIPDYIKYSDRLKSIISQHVISLLEQGLSVVLDYPGNTVNQRKWFRSIYEAANVSHVLHFVDVSDEVCKLQLKERSKDKEIGTAFTSEQEFNAITKYFEAPTDREGFNIVRYDGRKIQ